jgi:hypothetical protein
LDSPAQRGASSRADRFVSAALLARRRAADQPVTLRQKLLHHRLQLSLPHSKHTMKREENQIEVSVNEELASGGEPDAVFQTLIALTVQVGAWMRLTRNEVGDEFHAYLVEYFRQGG